MKGRLAWLLFGAGALGVLAFLAWVSRDLLDAREEARFQTSLRLALSRMDQRFSLDLATEARRPLSDYQAVSFLEEDAYTRGMEKIREEEILTPSRLLLETPDYALIHFQATTGGQFGSPQVPTGAARDRFVQTEEAQAKVEGNLALLERVKALVDPKLLLPKVAEAERKTATEAQWARTAKSARSAAVGSLEPLWQGDTLLFVRRVTINGAEALQGFLANWPRIRDALLGEIGDLLPGADLVPAPAGGGDLRLFTLPASLVAVRGGSAPAGWTKTHTILAMLWPTTLLALFLVAFALKKSIDFGERQRRFAGLVTHELRSPLTSFRLYSELLAEGLVKDEAKRAEYHRTLQREADQMARMVENVIAHARLEEGRAALHRERIEVGTLLERLAPDLERLAAKAGQGLKIDLRGSGGAEVDTDPGAVRQILANLVENACKYGRSDQRIEIAAERRDGVIVLLVRDHGPGIPSPVARRLFRPFERGNRDETDPARGLGLGLALSRGLARDLGGSLSHEAPPGGGACFALVLPAAKAADLR